MKVVLDSSVLVSFFRNPHLKEDFEARTRRPLLYMSSIVAMELHAGCRTPRHKTELDKFLKPFERAGRVIAPDHECFREAGRVLAKLARDGMGAIHRRQIANDVLIAVSASRFGATVITANHTDFTWIGRHVAARWLAPA